MRMWKRLKEAAQSLRREPAVYQAVRRDPRTPRAAAFLLALAIGYLALRFDIIPDFIPVLGHLDDAILVPALVLLARRIIPPDVMEDARRKAGS